MKKVLPLVLVFLFSLSVAGSEPGMILSKSLQWQEPVKTGPEKSGDYLLAFHDAVQMPGTLLPSFHETVFFSNPDKSFLSLEIKNPVFDSTDLSQFIRFDDLSQISGEFEIITQKVQSKNQRGVHISFLPLIRDAASGKTYCLISFELHIHFQSLPSEPKMLKQNFVNQSVLATGAWFKFSVSETGVHKITYNDLVKAGINPANINPRHIRLYGNGGGMFPESNSEPRHDDLIENAILVVGEENGTFNQQDYILFYGQSPHEWIYSPNSNVFEHRHNIYDDHNYYFLTTDRGMGKRITNQPNTNLDVTDVVNTFTDFRVHQLNTTNLMASGRQWFGESFDLQLTRNFTFSIPNRVLDSAVHVRANVAANSLLSSSFTFNINGTSSQTNVREISGGSYPPVARAAFMSQSVASSQENVEVNITYNKSTSNSKGWLNYIWVSAQRQLTITGDQMPFRNLFSTGSDRISEFRVAGTNASHRIWDVTDPANVKQQETSLQGNETVYKLSTDHLREFIVFDPSKAYTVDFAERVPNQNLHGAAVPDLLIVTHPLLLDEARRLAAFHKDFSGLDSLVVTTFEIYNEFSSGKQDVAAIRDFARMFYERSGNSQKFRYLLLFGDASYDYKDRIAQNRNFVPVWSSPESLDPLWSYITDDFFGFLDPHEGGPGANILDIGIGRLPLGSPEEAAAMVDKIIHYASNTQATMSDWRNVLCFVADDQDNSLHFRDTEKITNDIDANFSIFNLSKIYLDAYKPVPVPGGTRYPDVNQAINRRVQQGAMIVNFIGHGGVLGWTHERVLELTDIRGWTNFDRMPVFITATCEFAYFDDPSLASAGELVLLNPNGGGIALFTTSRPTFASFNFPLNRRLLQYAFEHENGKSRRLGDIILKAKQTSGTDSNARKFLLLGDPAIRMAIPTYNVITTHVNQQEITLAADTMRALSLVTIQGQINCLENELIEDFNGILTTTVFDKVQEIVTLTNDTGDTLKFKMQENIVYKGNASVINGRFSFSFIVPKDIAYAYGKAKISYYATDGLRDAHGKEQRIYIGGFNENAGIDNKGPEIELYMNDENFVSGGITNENPILFAIISDENGINTTGIGIGHDITAVLNHETNNAHFLNDFYEADLDTYQSGTIRYPFFNLPDGRHHLSLKVWDIYNNPSEASIEFVVATSGQIALREVLNYPNPFRDRTNFIVEHNQAGTSVEFEIYIYSIDGRLRKTLKEKIRPGGYRSEPLSWDGRGDDGQLLESGTYIYRVILRNQKTGVEELGNKLVIIR
jgi:hypothetical protein